MSRKVWRKILIAFLSLAWLIVGAEEISARWLYEDPTCSAVFAPNQTTDPFDSSLTTDPEGWFDWWSSCITDEADPPFEPPPDPPPPLCRDGHTFTDVAGKCWKMVCLTDYEWKLEACITSSSVFLTPQIRWLIIGTKGYVVSVGTKSGIKNQSVRPNQVGLLGLVRVMVRGARLPSEDILGIRQEYWHLQRKVVLKPKSVIRR